MLPVRNRIRTLLLELSYPHRVSYYDDWRDAFHESSDFECESRNILKLSPADLARAVEGYDAIVVLHSCNADTLEYFKPIAAVLGQRHRAKLVSFVGNEFNSPYVSMPERLALLKLARVDIIASQLLLEAANYLYKSTGAQCLSLPAGLNPKVFSPGSASRNLDIGSKGYRYPPFLGDEDRNLILQYVSTNAQRLGLKIQVDQDRRLARNRWAEFLKECWGTVSSEGGSWYLDPQDALMRNISDFLVQNRRGLVINNDSLVRRAARRLPYAVKSVLWRFLQHGPVKFDVLEDFKTSFAELNERFFRTAAPAPVYSKIITSRHFDAIGTKTALVMVRGRFNDVLQPDVNYFAVDRDFRNADDAFRRFKDSTARQRMADATYDLVMGAHTYVHRLRTLRATIEASSPLPS